jgi:hypothetical protein
MGFYPPSIVPENHVAPVPRRIRGFAGGRTVFDSQSALYVWEWPPYPHYYIPQRDVDTGLLTARGEPHRTPQGVVRTHDLRAGDLLREHAARLVVDSPRSTDGSKRMKKSSFTRAIRIHASMRFDRGAGFVWKSRASFSPSRLRPCSCSKRVCRRAITWIAET